MVQLGWNAGPRHARVWGLAKSFNRKIDKATMVKRDEDAIALMTLCWSLAKASMPGVTSRSSNSDFHRISDLNPPLLFIETYIALVSQFQTLLPRDDTLMDTASNIAHTSDLPSDPDLIPIT